LFENHIILEVLKAINNRGIGARLFFYRDSNQNEVDLLIEKGARPIPVEIKSSSSFSRSFLKGLSHWRVLTGAGEAQGEREARGFLVYAGKPAKANGVEILSHEDLAPLLRVLEA
jgi:predicted AAA+ superfamily ATPase